MDIINLFNKNIDESVRNSLRYTLVEKMMEENFSKWISQQSTLNLVEKLLEDCKKPNISMSTPSPIFVTKMNPINQSQTLAGQYSFMPPVSPNSSSLINYQSEKKNLLSESQMIKKKVTESMVISPFNKEETSAVPKFYFGVGYVDLETIEAEENLINQIFLTDELTVGEFLPITLQLLNFPKMFNSVLFYKINPTKEKISKSEFLDFHKKHFQGKDEFRKTFNFVKSVDQDYITRNDFIPFMKSLLENHPGLEFLKNHPEFQEKYTDIVILRIFYSCDLNDDNKISYREFKKSKILNTFKNVCEEVDINKIRDFFSYEHFYVLYCLFWDLDGNEHDFLIDKEEFSKYDGHSLSRKAADRIFSGVPRKFKSENSDKMGFEDFVWYLLSEEDKTTRTSIEYWFKVVDLDENGIITPHEMAYFYEEQIHRMQYLENEVVLLSDIICQLYDNIKPEKEHQFTLNNFLSNKSYASVFFNNLLNLNKFLSHEQKDPFSRTEIDKNFEFSDWDKFAYYEYQRLTADDNEENQDANDSGFFSNDNVVEEINPNSNTTSE